MKIDFYNNPDLLYSDAEINDWKSKYYSQLKKILIPVNNSKWGKLLCTWNEIKPNGMVLHHTYSATVDTSKLELYLDCRPRKIFAKCMVMLFTRPIHVFFKTLYHLSMIEVAQEIFSTYKGYQTKTEALKHSIKSLADIVRTPLYGVAMMVTMIAGMIIGLMFPHYLYDTRELLGKIEQSLNWGEIRTLGTHAPCFQPRSLIELTNRAPFLVHEEDTAYTTCDPLEVSLAHFARSAIRWRRKKYNIFDQCWGTLDINSIYVSKALEPLNAFLDPSNWEAVRLAPQVF